MRTREISSIMSEEKEWRVQIKTKAFMYVEDGMQGFEGGL